jgi:hypothetical protein
MVSYLDRKNLAGRNLFQLARNLTGTVFNFRKSSGELSP